MLGRFIVLDTVLVAGIGVLESVTVNVAVTFTPVVV